MNYGVILASGSGTRMKIINVPKQYYEIDEKPIIIYTLESLLNSNLFDSIYIAINKEYYDLVSNYLSKFISMNSLDKIKVVFGGKERIDTIHNVVNEISKNKINSNDVIVIHDAVRPLVTEKILKDSVDNARKYGAVVATVPVSDTMLMSDSGDYVDSIPERKTLYKGQAPDSFNLEKFIELESKLTDEQKSKIVGTSQICTMNNYPIKMIEGDEINFKVTTDSDLVMLKNIILSRKKNKYEKK